MKTFDIGLATDRDWVRVTIGDSVLSTAYFEDETLDAFLAEWPNKWLAAAAAGEALLISWTTAGKGVVEKKVDTLAIYRQIHGGEPESDYRDHLKRLREKGAEMVRNKGVRFIEML